MNRLIYIDESCHLENDKMPLMCIGYTRIKEENYSQFKQDFKDIKIKHKDLTEIKWNKLSMSRIELYKELIDYFFSSDIQFRAILVKNKSKLNHQKFKRDHNSFYYTLVFLLLRNPYINNSSDKFKVFLDIKDTRGKERLVNLQKRLEYEYTLKHDKKSPFNFFQHIRSDENMFLQLADLFIGAITFKSKEEHLKSNASRVKVEIMKYLEEKSGYNLDDGTNPMEEKFNIFDFQLQS